MPKSWKELREERPIPVSFVAKLLGVNPQTVRNKEKGLSEFDWIQASKLLKLYRIDISEVKQD